MDLGDMNSGVGPQRFGDTVSVDRPERWGERGRPLPMFLSSGEAPSTGEPSMSCQCMG